jgi:hypothetical protein
MGSCHLSENEKKMLNILGTYPEMSRKNHSVILITKEGTLTRKVTPLKELGINQDFFDMNLILCKNTLHNL